MRCLFLSPWSSHRAILPGPVSSRTSFHLPIEVPDTKLGDRRWRCAECRVSRRFRIAAQRRYRTPRRVDMSAGRGRDEPRIEIDHPLEAVDGHMLVDAVDHPGLIDLAVQPDD